MVGVSEYPLGGSEAVVWTAGGVVGLGDISTDFGFTSVATGVSADGSVVAGQGYSRSVEAFRWTQSDGMVGLGFLSPSGPFYSRATGISADGSVVVGASVVTGPENAFRWTQATGMVALTGPPIIASRANAASADGSVVVGYSYVGPVDSDAFIWDSVHGLRLVRDILVHDLGLTLTGWKLTEATGVSADGETVVGIGTNPSGDTEAWIANLGAQEVPMALTLPGALNLRSMGHWVTAYLQPPDGFDASAIDVSTIQLHGNVAGTNPVPVDQTAPTEIGDQNGDQIADLMVKFDRAAVELALTAGEAVPLTVTGTVAGQRFTGTTALKVLRAPITAPQGGSVLNAGTVCTVRWETPAEVSCQWVALLFSLDDGTNWTLVASGIPNSGSYDWMVPAAGSDLARVAVVLVESADATGDLVDGVLGVSEAFSIDALVGVNDRGPAQFALRGVTPNPAQHELRVSFSLGDSRAAKLALFDVSGRQMETRRVDGMGPGWHTVTLGGRSNLPVGLYVIRLTQDGRSLTTRAALVR